MAYTYHGTRDIITAPGRAVQTFPSGLVRVDRTYLCRRGDEARYRSQLAVGNPLPDDDGAPAIDGLYIFPGPQEQSRDDGFVEFRVTAYGRTNTTGYEKNDFEYTTDSTDIVGVQTSFITRTQILTQQFVVFGSEQVAPSTTKIPETPEVVLDTILSAGSFAITNARRYTVGIRSYTAINFGSVSEVTVVYAPLLLIGLQ